MRAIRAISWKPLNPEKEPTGSHADSPCNVLLGDGGALKHKSASPSQGIDLFFPRRECLLAYWTEPGRGENLGEMI